MSQEIMLWNGPAGISIPTRMPILEIVDQFNKQLTIREVEKVKKTYESDLFDMSAEYIWLRAMNLLKEKVMSFGIELVLEMLGRTDKGAVESLAEREIISLAFDLGFINKEGKLKLGTSSEMIQHYSSRDADEEMDIFTADLIISSCIKYIVGQSEDTVKFEYKNFRENLKEIVFKVEDCDLIINSPYFYRRTMVKTLLNLMKEGRGAEIQNIYGNIQIIIPAIWSSLLVEDKYPIGTAYAEAIYNGDEKNSTVLKSVLLKVKGFDFVPENLRSNSFINAAKNIINVHYAMDNFYNEPAAIRTLVNLGTVIPTPALGACVTATLIVKLGNTYGRSNDAQSYANEILSTMFEEKWKYYMDKVLIGEERILEKLAKNGGGQDIRRRWCEIVETYRLDEFEFEEADISNLIMASKNFEQAKVKTIATKILRKIVD